MSHRRLTLARLLEPCPPPPAARDLARLLLTEADMLAGSAGWSCGVPLLVVPVSDAEALARCHLDLPLWRDFLAGYATQKVDPVAYLADLRWRARMFAPGLGVAEDPATGMAAAAFAGWLAERLRGPRGGTLAATIEQGVEMGRPSAPHLELDRRAGAIAAVRVGAAAVAVAEGWLDF